MYSFKQIKKDDTSPSLLWETFKAVLQGKIISYNAHYVKQRKLKHQGLVDSILAIENAIFNFTIP
jgi:hypothetical protein